MQQREMFQKELVMTSDQASTQNQLLPKGYVYVPRDSLSKEKLWNRNTQPHNPQEPGGQDQLKSSRFISLEEGHKKLVQACSLQLKTTSGKQGWPVLLPQGLQPIRDLCWTQVEKWCRLSNLCECMAWHHNKKAAPHPGNSNDQQYG